MRPACSAAPPSEATLLLASYCADTKWALDPDVVSACVEEKADVLFRPARARMPLLHEMANHGLVECVIRCLQTPHDLDFTITGFSGQTLLHIICGGGISDESTAIMLKSVVQRLQHHPRDVVDWGKRDGDGMKFIANAADNQKLSVVWPIVKHDVPYFDDLVEGRISLRPWVWKWELDVLGPREVEESFSLECADIIDADPYTARLTKYCWQSNLDAEKVRECVEAGADLCFHSPGSLIPIIHQMMDHGPEECVAACLHSPRALDFTIQDLIGNTPLHHVCSRMSRVDRVVRIVEMVLDRLDERHSSDRLDWGISNRRGRDFITLAAQGGYLAAVWEVLKARRVPHFFSVNAVRPVAIYGSVVEADWNKLSDVDKEQFSIVQP